MPSLWHPPKAMHLNVEYNLSHLFQHFGQFEWHDDRGEAMAFSVRVRYSDHCYSDKLAFVPGCFRVGRDRVFCPIRHAHSLNLPTLMGTLFNRPTTTVSFTAKERNWSVFWLEIRPPLDPGHKYFAFFHVERSTPPRGRDGRHHLDLVVESAYQRSGSVEVWHRFPFGKVAERTARGIRI